MSLPLTRRIAKTVLLTAAGAASVVGAAGAASAAALPSTPDVGGLSNVDGAHLGKSVDDTSRSSGDMAAKGSGGALKGTLPGADSAVGAAGKSGMPTAQQAAGGAQRTLRHAASSTKGNAPAIQAPTHSGLPTDRLLTGNGLPLNNLGLPLG